MSNLRWYDLESNDIDNTAGEFELELAKDERIISVERQLDGGYNTDRVRVWIAKLS